MSKLVNIAKSALRGSNARVMLDKVRRRLEPDTGGKATDWARSRAISVEDWCSEADSALWSDVASSMDDMASDASERLSHIDYDLGGGGAYTLLAFLSRFRRPQVVVETGVAAGWSSRAILESLEVIGSGRLYSSDFPYFRIPNPEKYIGFVVPEELRVNWFIDIRGDRIALPEIAKMVSSVDLFHFDSDKSYAGRQIALECMAPLLAPSAVVIMDDIQDNLFFADWVEREKLEPVVFSFEGKYLGAVGL